MERCIQNIDDWQGGIRVGWKMAIEKYLKYVYQASQLRYMEKLQSIEDPELIESLFDVMMKETEIPISELENMMTQIHQNYVEQMRRNK